MVRRAQYIYLDSKLLAFLACFAELVYGPFGQSTMQRTLDFQFSAHASHERIECTKALNYLMSYCPNIYYGQTGVGGHQRKLELQYLWLFKCPLPDHGNDMLFK